MFGVGLIAAKDLCRVVERRRRAGADKLIGQPGSVPEEILDGLRAGCDIVVVGVGDCGSCSASAVADGIILEQPAIPAAVICTDAFMASADAMARVFGLAGSQAAGTYAAWRLLECRELTGPLRELAARRGRLR